MLYNHVEYNFTNIDRHFLSINYEQLRPVFCEKQIDNLCYLDMHNYLTLNSYLQKKSMAKLDNLCY